MAFKCFLASISLIRVPAFNFRVSRAAKKKIARDSKTPDLPFVAQKRSFDLEDFLRLVIANDTGVEPRGKFVELVGQECDIVAQLLDVVGKSLGCLPRRRHLLNLQRN